MADEAVLWPGRESDGEADVDEVVSPFEALEEWKRQSEREEAIRTLALAEPPVELPPVAPGTMRLLGNFTGFATTSTHQLELEVGLDLEMPSHMAADAMKQLAARSRSESPFRAAIMDALAPPEPPPPRSMFSSLAGFFRRDAEEAARPGPPKALENGPMLSLPDLQLTLESDAGEREELRQRCSALDEDRERLLLDLEASREEVTNLTSLRNELAEEHDAAADQLEATRRECATSAAHVKGLQLQVELLTQSNKDLNSQMRELEDEHRAADSRLGEVQRELEELRLASASAQSMGEQAEQAAASQRESHEALLRESDELRAELDRTVLAQARASTSLASVQGDVEAMVDENEALRAELLRLQEQLPSSPRSPVSPSADARARIAALEEELCAASEQAAEAVAAVQATQEMSDDQVANLLSQAGSLAASDKHRQERAVLLEKELASVQSKLSTVADEGLALGTKVQLLHAKLRTEEAAAAQAHEQVAIAQREAADARAEAAKLRTGHKNEAAGVTSAKQSLEQQVEAAKKEAGAAGQRAQEALGARDRARQELREARQSALDGNAQVLEELNQARQETAQAQNLEDELASLKRKCAALEASNEAMVSEAQARRAAPVLIQDNMGTCMIRSIVGGSFAVPAPTLSGIPMPTSPGSKRIGKITHIGTTIRSMGTYSGSFVAGAPGTSASFVAGAPQPISPTGALNTSSFSDAFAMPVGTTGPPVPVGTGRGAPMATSVGTTVGAAVVLASPMSSMALSGAGSVAAGPFIRIGRPSVVRTIASPLGPVRAAMTVRVVNARRLPVAKA